MVSDRIEQNIDNLKRPEPITVKSVPACFQDGKTFKTSRFECVMCDFFEECKKAKI
ncbi:MAG: hypothetical protein ACTSWR_06620 [Candidatus Helarchaeota archaeon]